MKAEGVDRMPDPPRGRRARLATAALLVMAVMAGISSCTRESTESGPDGTGSTAPNGATTAGGERYPELEGLVFVRDGAIWAIEEGSAARVIESTAPWSLRDSRSGNAVTFVSMKGTVARVHTAARGDWRAESMWETDLGSLLVEAVHDDVADVLWYSVSGEQTTTVGARDGTGVESEVPLPVEVAPYFSVRYADGTLFATGAAQEPAILYEVAGAARELFSAATLFYPRLSPDGATILVTGSESGGGRFHLWRIEIGDGSVTDLGIGPGAPTDPDWSSDGRRIVFRDTATGTVWLVPAEGGPATDTGLRADEGGLAW